MADINNMNIYDFMGIINYSNIRAKRRDGGVVPLKESQKEMIRRTKEKEKNGT